MDWLVERLVGGLRHILLSTTWQFEGHAWIGFAFFPFVALVDFVSRRHVHRWTTRLWRSIGATVALYFLNGAVYPILLTWALLLKRAYDGAGIPHLPASLWTSLPGWAVTVFAVVAYDFSAYWSHRALHLRWLWPIHAIHHSDPEVIALTTLRVHALEGIVMFLFNVALLTWLGLPPGAVGLAGIFVMLHNQYVHVRLDWSHGPLRHVIASPRFHRWHHADVPEAYGKNLSNMFPVWDLLFGTHYDPHPCRERMGATGVPENDVVRLMLFPFGEWARMIGEAVRRDHAATPPRVEPARGQVDDDDRDRAA